MQQQIKLRPYQEDGKRDVFNAWNSGQENVLLVLSCGAGKTVIFSDIIREHVGASCAIAHRQELVSQISLALARDRVRHRIIGPKAVVKLCVGVHMAELGTSYYDPAALCGVAGVDTLVRRKDTLAHWLNTVTLWVMDEAHHVLEENKWGDGALMFKNARGLGVTATPERTDGKGLSRNTDGLFDTLVEGPGMRELINMGYLTPYRIFAPPSDIDLSTVNLSKATGDYNPVKLKTAVRRSHVVGDVVKHYLRIAPGKLGVTFASDVETATDTAAQFRAEGVPAEVVHAKTSDAERIAILRRFKAREVLQLVNVDLFGEGFDLPAIEVVSMARPTASYGLYVQQFGRGLRPMEGKTDAIIIDHVGNVVRHGLPDAPREWSLDRREKRASTDTTGTIPVRACPECTQVYERIHAKCPHCGFHPVPAARNGPEFVDGDLCELDAETLAAMRGEVSKIDLHKERFREQLIQRNVPKIGQLSQVKKHVEKQEAQTGVRDAISWWAGYQRAAGKGDPESYRRFYHKFGIDVLSAQALGVAEAEDLTQRINAEIGR